MNRFEIWYPVKPVKINQYFGGNGQWYQNNGVNIIGHNGWDFNATNGQPVRAAHDGEVVYTGCDNREGYGVVIRTTEPFLYNGQEVYFKSIYWHLLKDIPAKLGKVKCGDIIGYADNTGLSAGTHLHFGLKPQAQGENNWTWYNTEQDNGYLGSINPAPYWSGFAAQDKEKAMSILEKILQLLKDFWEKYGTQKVLLPSC